MTANFRNASLCVHGGQSLDLGSSIVPEVVTNGNIPRRRPSAEPLVKHDGRGAAIGEADIEVAAVRHILLMQGNVDAALLPQQFDDRFLIDCVANRGKPARDLRASRWDAVDGSR
jgi:hypothetical protein